MVRRGRVTVCGLTGLAMLAACSSFTGTGPGPGELDAGVGDGAAVESASDGSGDDGGPCRSRSTPTQPCFVSGSCTTSSVSTSVTLPGALTLKYPHDPARWENKLFFVIHRANPEGRNRADTGVIFRVDLPSMQNLTQFTNALDRPGWLRVDGHHLYWREIVGAKSEIRRIDLAPRQPCIAGCTPEVVVSIGGQLEPFDVVSENDVYFRHGDSTLKRTVRSDAGWQPPTTSTSASRGILGRGLWAGRIEATRTTSLYAVGAPGAFEPIATWQGEDPGIGVVVASCRGTFLFDRTRGDLPLQRIALGAGGGISPVPCTNNCRSEDVYGLSADGSFAYVATPNAGGGIRAYPLAGGAAANLITGDIWNVVEDDDALYFADVDGARVGRIAKHAE